MSESALSVLEVTFHCRCTISKVTFSVLEHHLLHTVKKADLDTDMRSFLSDHNESTVPIDFPHSNTSTTPALKYVIRNSIFKMNPKMVVV